jgi:cardiolipin synthase
MGTVPVFCRLFAAGAAIAVAGCAMPPIDRAMLDEARAGTQVRLETAKGPLSYKQSQEILEGLKKKSVETSIFDRHLAVEEAINGAPPHARQQGDPSRRWRRAPIPPCSPRSSPREAQSTCRSTSSTRARPATNSQDALTGARQKGVKVAGHLRLRRLEEHVEGILRRAEKSGVEVLEYRPLDPASMLKGQNINQRNHRKLFVIDGRIAFLGGINISEGLCGEFVLPAQQRRAVRETPMA